MPIVVGYKVTEEHVDKIWVWHLHVVYRDGENNADACRESMARSLAAMLNEAFQEGREFERKMIKTEKV